MNIYPIAWARNLGAIPCHPANPVNYKIWLIWITLSLSTSTHHSPSQPSYPSLSLGHVTLRQKKFHLGFVIFTQNWWSGLDVHFMLKILWIKSRTIHCNQRYDLTFFNIIGLIPRAQYSLRSAPTSSRHSQQHLLRTHLISSKITRRIQRPDTVSNDKFDYICETMKNVNMKLWF